jgi:hypothetical protein
MSSERTGKVQTEEEERAAVISELALLSGGVWRATGRMPVVIDTLSDSDGFDLTVMSTAHIADLCDEVRTEYNVLLNAAQPHSG